MRNALAVLAILVGVFFTFVASLGILRFPDFYLRVHAPTKAATLGLFALTLASFFADRGNSVPEVHRSGPSAGIAPSRGTGRDSIPNRQTAKPPTRASHTTAVSASCMSPHRSSGAWS